MCFLRRVLVLTTRQWSVQESRWTQCSSSSASSPPSAPSLKVPRGKHPDGGRDATVGQPAPRSNQRLAHQLFAPEIITGPSAAEDARGGVSHGHPLLFAVRPLSGAIRTLSRNRRMTGRGPTTDLGRIKIPQRSNLLPHRGVLSFRLDAREGPAEV